MLQLCCHAGCHRHCLERHAGHNRQLSAGGTGVIEKPGIDFSEPDREMLEPEFGAGDADKDKEVGGGKFRLLYLYAEKNTEKSVVSALTTVVPTISELEAANCYHTAKKLGMGIVTSTLKEHAEMYAQQLSVKGLRTKVEPDSALL